MQQYEKVNPYVARAILWGVRKYGRISLRKAAAACGVHHRTIKRWETTLTWDRGEDVAKAMLALVGLDEQVIEDVRDGILSEAGMPTILDRYEEIDQKLLDLSAKLHVMTALSNRMGLASASG